ncbi:MAG: hypothetical protein WCD12_17625 [Candidatus Binatus sp.]|jgi:hypothetical protein|uniref:hypothetical protein n=1 Tax=Candidatus Binatus sp. TaxID=2811406 RepID=UPI003C71D736
MTSPDRAQRRWQSLLALAIYFAIAVLLLDRGLVGHPGYYIGRDTDPPQTMWFFNWWRFSLAHGLNPFVSDWVWAPLGSNLAWATFVPLPAWFSIPLQVTVGEPATYNLIITLALPLAAFSAFLLCRHVTRAFWPSVLGGYIFGFSSYMLGEVLVHLDLVSVFPVPLIALLTLKKLDGEISARRFALLLAALLTMQFLCFPELFATITIVGGFALLLGLALFGQDLRTRLIGLIPPAIAGCAITAGLLSPYLFYMLARGFPHSPIWKPGTYSADLLAFVVPTETVMLGTARLAGGITQTFQSDIYENGAYLGIAIIFFIEVFRRRYWREPVGKFLTLMFVVLVIAAMGPSLHIAGQQGFWMPWAIVGRLPLISVALPVRFMLYAFLVVAIMIAIWFAASPARPLTKRMAAAVILLSIAPNMNASFWVSSLDIPAFFTDRTYATELEPREIIMPLPWGQRGNSMYWQLQSDMYFRMAGGWTGISPFEFARMPVANYFYGGIDLPEPADQLKAYIARFGVQAVIADPIEPNFESFKQTLDGLGVEGLKEKGVWIYKIPPDSFAAYAKLPSAQIEARANALRFDAILEAAGKYLATGHALSKLSALELKRLDLLPHDWLVDATPHAYSDWEVGLAAGGGLGIIIVGSYEGVRPLIERYRGIASEIDYPAPTPWTPDSHPRIDVIQPLLVTFNSAELASAVQRLRDSPPAERTTPFVAGAMTGL